MKKICSSLIALACAVNFCHAQWSTSGSNIYNSNTGNVGIGTTTPGEKIHVVGNILTSNASGAVFRVIGSTNNTASYNLQSYSAPLYINEQGNNTLINAVTGGNVGIGTTTPADIFEVAKTSTAKIKVYAPAGYTYPSDFGSGVIGLGLTRNDGIYTGGIYSYTSPAGDDNIGIGSRSDIVFLSGAGALGQQPEAMRISSAGNIGIATTDTHGYKFAVNGSAIATSMTVQLYANWPDYVFKKDYRLPKLTDVKNYIDANHRLPEMPSEQDIAKNGLNLGEMNRLLTKKVEELTLYLIDQQKLNQSQQGTNASLQKELDQLKKEVSNLKLNK